MTIWSSYSETFYRHLLDTEFSKRNNKRPDKNLFKKLIDASCCNISTIRRPPRSSKEYEDYLFLIPGIFELTHQLSSDSLNDGQNLNQKEEILNCRINPALVTHKSQGIHTSRRINSLYIASGNIRDTLYSMSYERSQYTNVNQALYADRAISKTNIFSLIQREIINSTETVYLFDNNSKDRVSPLVIKPSGVLNSGIMGVSIEPELLEDEIRISVKERFTLYPSCFFYYLQNNSGYFMDPYKEQKEEVKLECSWDGYNIKSKIHSENGKFANVNEDIDILEIKADNKSIFASTIYARNFLGLSVFSYYYDGDWKIKPLNNVSFKENDKIFYMSVSPYIPNEALFLKTTNEMLVYDGNLGYERDRVLMSKLIKDKDDVVQTVCYGMDNQNIVMGGNKLYQMDKRDPKPTLLFLPAKSTMTITSAKWTERKYEQEFPIRHYQILLNGRACSFSSYYRKSRPSYWECFTAMEVHPKYNYILAAVCGTNNSIYIIDLRITDAPVLDIPISSSEVVGSRIRSIKWFCKKNESYILVFSWKLKYPLITQVEINTASYSFTNPEKIRTSPMDFEFDDMNYDTLITFERSRYIDFLNTDPDQEESDFPTPGPLVESQKDYSEFPIQMTKESALTNIFHGFMGATPVYFKSKNITLIAAFTISGKLLCQDLENRKLSLKTEQPDQNQVFSDIDLEDESGALAGFTIFTKNVINGIPFPKELKFDIRPDEFSVRKTTAVNKYEDYTSINISEKFIKLQEQRFEDIKRYSLMTVNECFAIDTKYNEFNSKKILEMVMAFNMVTKENNENIMSLAQFIRSYGTKNLDSFQSWNPLDMRLDYEYENDFNNPLIEKSEICSCSKLNNQNYQNYRESICKIFKWLNPQYYKVQEPMQNTTFDGAGVNSDPTVVKSPNLNNYFQLHLIGESEGLQKKMSDKVKNKESLLIDEGLLSTYGSSLVLNSSIGNDNRGTNNTYVSNIDSENKETENTDSENTQFHNDKFVHRKDCPANEFLFLELSQEHEEEFEYIPFVDELLSTWVLEPKDKRKPDLYPSVSRSFDPGDIVEDIREHTMQHKELISQILSNTEAKTQ